MSSPWNVLRTVNVASLPDPLPESTQVALAPTFGVARTRDSVAFTGDVLQEIGVIAIAYDGANGTGNVVAGTLDLQVIEVTPYPSIDLPRDLYVGRPPVVGIPTGRLHVFNARYLHSFTVLVSALAIAGVSSVQVLWRTYR